MIQPASTGLHVPFLLVTDHGENSDSVQQLLYPILAHWTTHLSETGLLAVLAIKGQVGSSSGQELEIRVPARISVTYQESQGRPVAEAVSYAQTLQAGLVAVACRGSGKGKESRLRNIPSALGSTVSQGLARHAPCPVLLVPPTSRPIANSLQWRHIVLVVSASEASRQAIAITKQLLPVGVEQVTLLCIEPPLNSYYWFGPFAPPPTNWQFNQYLQQIRQEQSQLLLQQAEETLEKKNLTVQRLILQGEGGPLICQVAQQHEADAILLGSDAMRYLNLSRYDPAFRPGRLTATADYVIHHASCPVLLCRTIQPATPDRTPYLSRLKLYATGIPGTR